MLHAYHLPALDAGAGHSTVVWLHGFLGTAQEWQWFTQCLPQYHHLRIDLPGHGASQHIGVTDFAQTDALIREQLRHHVVRRYVMVGYSLGGRIAMYHAATNPSGLAGLLVEGCHPGLTDRAEREARCQHDAHWAERFRTEALTEVLMDWYRQPVFAELNQDKRGKLVAVRQRQQGSALAQMLEATSLGRQPCLVDRLTSLSFPWVYLCGEQDKKFRHIAGQYGIPVQLITPAGHNAHRENPQGFLQVVKQFLLYMHYQETHSCVT